MGDHETPYPIGASNKVNCSTVGDKRCRSKMWLYAGKPEYLDITHSGCC